METNRNFANIARRVIDPDDDGQNLQQFMSDSPWSAQPVFDQIQAEICQRPQLSGGMLALDESGDERAGDQSAGAARQYLGRMGKVDMGQVGVLLSYYKDGIWTMVDAELFLPEVWFDQDHARLRERWHIPADRTFATKPGLGLEEIRRAKANGLPFEVVGCDSLYGRNAQFRADLDAEEVIYMADIPANTLVYLEEPVVGVPETPPGKRGRPFLQWRVLNEVQPVQVRALETHPDFILHPVDIRHTERGMLTYECAARRVWTIPEAGQVREEWLFVRREADGTLSFSLSNAPTDTPLARLALWRSQRYFVERTFQDAKSEAGWDELEARKYRAWMHHTALDALALWFVAETKLDWAQAHPRDPELVEQLEVEVLPALSMANVRELLKATLPLEQLSPEQATDLVVKHLVNRSRSTRSRLKAQHQSRAPT
jgi:SRSO17 transposase